MYKFHIDASKGLIQTIVSIRSPHLNGKEHSCVGVSCLTFSSPPSNMFGVNIVSVLASGGTDGTVCRYDENIEKQNLVKEHKDKVNVSEFSLILYKPKKPKHCFQLPYYFAFVKGRRMVSVEAFSFGKLQRRWCYQCLVFGTTNDTCQNRN